MQVAAAPMIPTEAQPTVWSRTAPVLGGLALGGAAVYTAVNDPRTSGHFPGCPFHALTGLWCPGCGLTRGVHDLFTGHPVAALGQNVFVFLAVAAIAAAWWNWARSGWGLGAARRPAWLTPFVNRVLPPLLIAYMVLRNVPWAPLRALAPS